MTLQTQWKTIKSNWLVVAALLVLVLLPYFNGPGIAPMGLKSFGAPELAMDMAVERSFASDGFAPEYEERKITTSASMTSEVKRGEFKKAEQQLKAIITSTDSILANENVNKNEINTQEYTYGYYQISVDTKKYQAVLTQLREIGEIVSFNENSRDITSNFQNTRVDLLAEQARLDRLEELYLQADTIQDQLLLSDRIFNQERTVKYLEDRLKNIDERVEYTTINVQLREKQSEYMGIALVKISELARALVNSINGVLKLIFIALPYAIVIGAIFWFKKRFKKSKK